MQLQQEICFHQIEVIDMLERYSITKFEQNAIFRDM
jgi:hypothetical protein